MSTLATPKYAPDFMVELSGRPMPTRLRARVMSVRFEEALEGANRVELQLASPDVGTIDRSEFDLGVSMSLSLGYHPGTMTPVFSGTVTGVEPTFPSTGMPALLVSAHDATVRLSQGTKERGFPYYLTDSVVATIVAAEHQLIAMPDVAASLATGLSVFNQRPRLQYKESDYDFLRRVAKEYGFDMWVDGPFLNFKLSVPGLPRPDIDLRWGESLIEFTPRVTSIGAIARVTTNIWVESLKSQFGVEVSWDGDRVSTRVGTSLFSQQGEPVEATLSLPGLPVDSAVDAIKFVVGELRRRVNSRVTARGTAVGDPRFRVGRLVAVSGVGRRFSASTYRITSAAHTLDSGGYRTTFEARREVV